MSCNGTSGGGFRLHSWFLLPPLHKSRGGNTEMKSGIGIVIFTVIVVTRRIPRNTGNLIGGSGGVKFFVSQRRILRNAEIKYTGNCVRQVRRTDRPGPANLGMPSQVPQKVAPILVMDATGCTPDFVRLIDIISLGVDAGGGNQRIVDELKIGRAHV